MHSISRSGCQYPVYACRNLLVCDLSPLLTPKRPRIMLDSRPRFSFTSTGLKSRCRLSRLTSGRSPKPSHVAHRRHAEEPLVLSTEVRVVVVAHTVACARGV